MKQLFKVLRLLVILALAAVLLISGLLSLLRWRGLILEAYEIDPHQWDVFGVDVSSYQGDVDWDRLAAQGVDFAFIKASEGSSLQDRLFDVNWKGAAEAGIYAGAYHYFSYDSPGETQAENFISRVPVTPGMLPPVIDLEFYGRYLQDPPGRDHVRQILDPLLARLEEYYGAAPILYVTYRSYYLYIAGGGYDRCPVWCSSPKIFPLVPGWDFWQYSHTARMEGYKGSQGRIDLNVFNGDMDRLKSLTLPGREEAA